MASRGESETLQLRNNLQDQLTRLRQQLNDLEEMREEFDDDEYEEEKEETLKQISECEESLKRMMDGSMTLVNENDGAQLQLQAKIREAFKTPEVIAMFAKKEPNALRARLGMLEADLKLGRISNEAFDEMASEIIIALEKLGEELTMSERHIYERTVKNMDSYITQNDTNMIGQQSELGIIAAARDSISEARKSIG